MKTLSDDPWIDMPNPPSWRLISMGIFGMLFCAFIGIIIYDDNLIDTIGWLFLSSFGVIYLSLALYREFIHRPKRVFIDDDGVTLQFRLSRPRRIPWDGILWILASEGDPSTTMGRWARDGAMAPLKGYFYSLTYEVANEIREAYRRNVGRYPTTRGEYEAMKRQGHSGAWR